MKIKAVTIIFLLGIAVTLVKSQNNTPVIGHYLFNDFIQGQVKFKNGMGQGSKLNYNSFTEEMVFDKNGTKLALTNLETIDTVIIEGRKFVPVEKVFYEIPENSSAPVYIHHTCTITPKGQSSGYGGTSETSAITTGAMIYDKSGRIYELKLPDEYNIYPHTDYLFRKENKYYKISDSKSVIRLFPEKQGAIKEFVKANRTSFKKVADIQKLLIFCTK